MRTPITAFVSLSLLLSTGASATDFGFSAPTMYNTDGYAIAVAIGDVTADGRPDLVVANDEWPGPTLSNHVLIFEQMPDGQLAPPVAVRYGTDDDQIITKAIELADLNGDGVKEIVVGAPGYLAVLTRQTDGSFVVSSIPIAPFKYPTVLVSTDSNGDGKVDLIAQNITDRYARVFLGDGYGGVSSSYTLLTSPSAIGDLTVGDINGDGHEDLLSGGFSTWPNPVFAAHFQHGAGGYGPLIEYRTPDYTVEPRGVAVGDFTGDGRTDVATMGNCYPSSPASLWLFRQLPSGELNQATEIFGPCGGFPEARDVDLDGRADLVLGSTDLVVYRGVASSLTYFNTFPVLTTPPYSTQQYESFALGDLNGDACIDAAITDANRTAVAVVHGENCRPAADLAVELFDTGAGSPTRELLAQVRHLGGHVAEKVAVTLNVAGRDRIEAPANCKQVVFGRSYTKFICFIEQSMTVGGVSDIRFRIGGLSSDLGVGASVSSSLIDSNFENNQDLLRLIP